MKLKYLWLWYFPLLFLPNLGHSIKTPNGTLELSDFLIGPYILLLATALPWGKRLNVGRLSPWLLAFVYWAIFTTITIPLRYDYAAHTAVSFGALTSAGSPVQFGLLKIAKLCLYGLAGVMTARALADEHARRAFDWSLLVSAVVVGVSLFSLGSGQGFNPRGVGETYSATNGTSVMVAILVTYLVAWYLTGHGSARWRFWARLGLIPVAAGFFLSDGRGGWIAAIAGLAYLVVRLGFRRQVLLFLAGAALVIAFFYQTQSDFRHQVDMTIFPTEFPQQTTDVGGVDNGGRFETWAHEAPKFLNSPIMGTGFYHRGGLSGLWSTGAHNYFIEIFLETGAIGGILMLAVVVVMWRQASSLLPSLPLSDIPLKAALAAAIVGGMSESYYYGGIVLFSVFAVYAATGSLPSVEFALRKVAPSVPVVELPTRQPRQHTLVPDNVIHWSSVRRGRP